MKPLLRWMSLCEARSTCIRTYAVIIQCRKSVCLCGENFVSSFFITVCSSDCNPSLSLTLLRNVSFPVCMYLFIYLYVSIYVYLFSHIDILIHSHTHILKYISAQAKALTHIQTYIIDHFESNYISDSPRLHLERANVLSTNRTPLCLLCLGNIASS